MGFCVDVAVGLRRESVRELQHDDKGRRSLTHHGLRLLSVPAAGLGLAVCGDDSARSFASPPSDRLGSRMWSCPVKGPASSRTFSEPSRFTNLSSVFFAATGA